MVNYRRGTMKQKNTLSILAIIFAGVSLLILPPVFGLAAFVLGLIATIKKEKLGVLGLILGIVLPIIGMVIGAAIASAMLN
ncbi:MAG: hypothetical protein RL488_1106 [Actinomycetota bacterium]|jgi:hypothetical protein